VAESEETKGRKSATKKSASPTSRANKPDRPDSREGAATTVASRSPTIVELLARGQVARLPWAGASVPFTQPMARAALATRVTRPAPLELPRAPVDRNVPPTTFTLDVPVRDEDTNRVVFILRREYGFPSGAFPTDAAAVRPAYDAVRGVCRALAPGAAIRCAAWGRYR